MTFSSRNLKLKITTLIMVIILFNCIPSRKVSAQDNIPQLFEDIRIQIEQSEIHEGSKTAFLARLSVAEEFYSRGKYDQSINHLDRLREWVIQKTPKHVPETTSQEITQELEGLT